jgi:hypothetical protein
VVAVGPGVEIANQPSRAGVSQIPGRLDVDADQGIEQGPGSASARAGNGGRLGRGERIVASEAQLDGGVAVDRAHVSAQGKSGEDRGAGFERDGVGDPEGLVGGDGPGGPIGLEPRQERSLGARGQILGPPDHVLVAAPAAMDAVVAQLLLEARDVELLGEGHQGRDGGAGRGAVQLRHQGRVECSGPGGNHAQTQGSEENAAEEDDRPAAEAVESVPRSHSEPPWTRG